MKPQITFEDTSYLEAQKQRSVPVNHIHWDGSIPAEDLFDFYQAEGQTLLLPEKDVAGNPLTYESEKERVIDSPEKLREFQTGLLTKYGIVDVFAVPVGAMQTKESLKAMARAHCRYLKEHNIPSAETRFAPIYHTGEGLSMNQVIGYALEGFAQGEEETGVQVNPIICINREVDPDTGEIIVKAALDFAERGVVGIDLACFEPPFPPDKFLSAYQLTFDSPLKRTAHAGEMFKDAQQNLRNVWYVLENFRPHGIAHAVDLHQRYFEGHDLIEMMVEGNVRLESNPISNSNFFIDGVEDLHLDQLVDAGVLVTINPDDPGMWPNGDLSHNLYVLGKLYGDDFLDKVVANAWKTKWN